MKFLEYNFVEKNCNAFIINIQNTIENITMPSSADKLPANVIQILTPQICNKYFATVELCSTSRNIAVKTVTMKPRFAFAISMNQALRNHQICKTLVVIDLDRKFLLVYQSLTLYI